MKHAANNSESTALPKSRLSWCWTITLATVLITCYWTTSVPTQAQELTQTQTAGQNIHTISLAEQSTTNTSKNVRYGWPSLNRVKVLRKFDPPAKRWLAGHRGVDLQISPGSPVYAAADGTVAFAGDVAKKSVVSILHADGIRTTYEPVKPSVSRHDFVKRGQVIGTLLPGHEKDALHWGARREKDNYLNPLSLLLGPIRLKPWTG